MQTQPDYSDYLLGPPTDEQRATLRKERNRTLADPLEKGIVLAWDAHNLHPESLPPTDYPHAKPPHPTPHMARPILSPLLATNSPAGGGMGWQLRLVEGVQTGEDKWSQVWRCKVADGRGQELAGSVVLKLYQQSLFPIPGRFDRSAPEHDYFVWHPAPHAVERESQAYRCVSLILRRANGADPLSFVRTLLNAYQGRDMPLCYGFYRFTVPSGEDVPGVVLEDLAETMAPILTSLKRDILGKRVALAKLDDWASFSSLHLRRKRSLTGDSQICGAFEIQHRFHQHDEPSALVYVGFSKAARRDHLDALREQWFATLTSRERRELKPTRTRDEGEDRALLGQFERTFEDEDEPLMEWKRMEKERRRLPWVHYR
ncbi:hypothetical protein JCM10450v2_004843 [Rhodotorula kratochvilovae]